MNGLGNAGTVDRGYVVDPILCTKLGICTPQAPQSLGDTVGNYVLVASLITGAGELVGGGELTAKQIIENVSRAERAQGLQYLKGFLSPAEARLLSNPKMAALTIGKAVHRATARALDRLYPGRFKYFETRGMDFLDKTKNKLIELATEAQKAYKMRKYGVGPEDVATYIP